MANTVTFSVGGSGGGGSNIKSIQHVSFSLSSDKFSEKDSDVWELTLPLEHVINPDKSIVIVPPIIHGYGSHIDAVIVYPVFSYYTTLTSIENDSITISCVYTTHSTSDRDPITKISWTDNIINTIQIIEFE